MSGEIATLTTVLARAGFLSADDEAAQLVRRAGHDPGLLNALVTRRLTGEPLAWVTGSTWFCDAEVRVDPGVYVPRWHTEPLVHRAIQRLPARGIAVDLCTGSGAVARTLSAARPHARVLATDIDDRAVACARANGVEAYAGDLFAPLPALPRGSVDVVIAVVPYVPTPALATLQRDTFTFESTLSYDGGTDGTAILRRVLEGSREVLRPGGALLLELGGEQAELLGDDLARLGYIDVRRLVDEDGDLRGVEARRAP